MFNQVTLVGNLTRDIELRYSQSGLGIASTAIATSRKYTSNGEKKEEVMFIDITFFARSAEIANQYLRKGSKILVVGRLNFDQWVDQNGQKRSKHTVIVETMQMLDSKPQGEAQAYPQQQVQDDTIYTIGNVEVSKEVYDAYMSAQQQQTPTYSHSNHNVNNSQQQAQQQSYGRPPAENVPEIDIDEDEIPF